MQHLYFSFMQTYRILLSPTSQRLAVHPLSPERETCCMLFTCETIAFLLSLSVSSSIILSYALTKWYQLSTDIRRSPFLSRKERRFVFSLFRALGCLPFYKRTFRFTPTILMKLHSHSTLSSSVIFSFALT